MPWPTRLGIAVGLVCFDDYGWWTDPASGKSAKLAIDAVLAVMKGRCELLKKDYQVWVRKPL